MSSIKLNTTSEQLCRKLPPQFLQYFQHVESLDFEQRPDYDKLRGLFNEMLESKGWENDRVFDWMLLSEDDLTWAFSPPYVKLLYHYHNLHTWEMLKYCYRNAGHTIYVAVVLAHSFSQRLYQGILQGLHIGSEL